MKNIKKVLVLISFFAILAMFTGTVSAANWTVDPGNSIQSVINNASSNDTIIVNDNNGSAYTYTENLVINKTLTLQAQNGVNVTIQALNSSNPVFTINSLGSGTTIQGFTIKGATGSPGILLRSTSSCNINGNNLINNRFGIQIKDSCYNNTIQNNMITNSTSDGINLGSGTNTNITIKNNTFKNNSRSGVYFDGSGNNIAIYENTITNSRNGINLRGSNNTIQGNIITNNEDNGIYIRYGSSNINFNRIFGNSLYGLYVREGIVNVTNNWWGSNNPIVSSSNGSDIYIENGTVTYNPWLVLNVTASPAITNENSTITADLTHNNAGQDTSSQGHIPDNIPVNFITDLGTVTGTIYTRNGQASATFNRGTATSGTANITATLNGQNVQTNVTIDITAPDVIADLAGGIYNTNQNVTLNATDNLDSNPAIYYTLDGNNPTTSSTRYTNPINITNTLILKFFAVDTAGNQAQVQTIHYAFNIPIMNVNTGVIYSRIQDAIDNATASDIIQVNNGTYTENIIVNKTLTLVAVPDGNVIINAANSSNPVITINSIGNSSTIQRFILSGSSNSGIYIDSSTGNYITGNNINGLLGSGNTLWGIAIVNSNATNVIINNNITNCQEGINLYNSSNIVITGNNITNSVYDGVALNLCTNNTISGNTGITHNISGIRLINNSNNNEISNNDLTGNIWASISIDNSQGNQITDDNILSGNQYGIYLYNSLNSTISGNNILNNSVDGIYLNNSSATINFNRIFGNSQYGLYNDGNGTIDATNNWWGSNADPSTNSNNIYNNGGTVTYNPWLVLNVTSSCDRSNRTGTTYNYIITADVTHNNQGNDTSSDGNIPDDLPIYFNTTLGTIDTFVSIRNGKAVAILNSTAPGIANVTATLDNQPISILVNVTSTDDLGIYNVRTGTGFTTIQSAIEDATTQNGDTITLADGTYTENVVVDKQLTIMPVSGQNVIVQAADPNSDIFTINNAGSGSTIQGFTIIGATNSTGIFLNSTSNCNIAGNIISDNNLGIYLNSTNNNTISGSTITYNYDGIYLYNSTGNGISGNNITNNLNGIYLYSSNNNIITENNVTSNWDGIYLYNSNSTISGNNVTDNDFGIYFYDSNSTLSGNNVTNNWDGDISQTDTTGIIMANTSVNCGPAALATVLNNMGINVTQDELATLAGTDETGTTMYGLAQAAQAKGLIAKGLKLSVDQLRPNNIVFLTINGEGHYSIVTNITDTTIYLADPDLGNINMTLANFTADYSGDALIVTNDTNNTQLNNGTALTTEEMQNIKGEYFVYVWVYGWFWSWWKWVYGSWWWGYTWDGKKYWFVNMYPSWHKIYGSFWIYWWHPVRIWHTGTLPWNYVGRFHPPSYDDLHDWWDRWYGYGECPPGGYLYPYRGCYYY